MTGFYIFFILGTTDEQDDTVDKTDEQKDGENQEVEFQEWNIETMPHRKSPLLEDGNISN